MQQGQVFTKGPSNWAYSYRLGGRDSKRVQQSGFPTERAAEQALDRALERSRQEQGLAETPTLSELVEIYLAQHETEPETIAYGHRFEATQALRQTLARAVSWGMINSNPAKQGVKNRQRPRVE